MQKTRNDDKIKTGVVNGIDTEGVKVLIGHVSTRREAIGDQDDVSPRRQHPGRHGRLLSPQPAGFMD